MDHDARSLMVRIAEIEVDPLRIDEYTRILAEEIDASLTLEPGVIALDAVALKDQPNHIRLLEVYASQQAYEAHLQSAHFIKYKTLTTDMVLALRLLDVQPIRMRGITDDASTT